MVVVKACNYYVAKIFDEEVESWSKNLWQRMGQTKDVGGGWGREQVELGWFEHTVASISATASISVAMTEAPTLPLIAGLNVRGGCL
jgi:hypothetical protein